MKNRNRKNASSLHHAALCRLMAAIDQARAAAVEVLELSADDYVAPDHCEPCFFEECQRSAAVITWTADMVRACIIGELPPGVWPQSK